MINIALIERRCLAAIPREWLPARYGTGRGLVDMSATVEDAHAVAPSHRGEGDHYYADADCSEKQAAALEAGKDFTAFGSGDTQNSVPHPHNILAAGKSAVNDVADEIWAGLTEFEPVNMIQAKNESSF